MIAVASAIGAMIDVYVFVELKWLQKGISSGLGDRKVGKSYEMIRYIRSGLGNVRKDATLSVASPHRSCSP